MFQAFKPINDNILVELKPQESKSVGGIIIPDQSQEKNQSATVVHNGHSGQLEIGDVIYYKKYAGIPLDDKFLVLKETDILGVL